MDLSRDCKKWFEGLQQYINSYDERGFTRLATLLYFCLLTVNVLTHEMWRDEMRAWILSRASISLPNLFYNLRYEGHPPLWFVALYLLSRITQYPGAMQFLHLMIATGATYIFLRFSPFTRAQKLLFIFGYFPLYEYATISRNYATGILLIFLFCALFRPGINKNYLAISVTLFLLSQTSAYGFIIAVCMTCMLGFEVLSDRELRFAAAYQKRIMFLCVCLILAGLLISAIVMIPSSDSPYLGWVKKFDTRHFQETLISVWQAFVPIPRLGKYCFWNTNVLPGRTLPTLLSVVLLCFLLLLFVRKRIILFTLSLCLAGIFGFRFFVYPGFIRHYGHLFIIFIVCLWLEKYYLDDMRLGAGRLSIMADVCARYKKPILNILLGVHCVVGLYASGMDWFCPFSQAESTAAYIATSELAELPISGDIDYCAENVAGYLNRPVYYPRSNRFGAFVIFDKVLLENVGEGELIEKTQRLARENKSNVLLVLSHSLEEHYDSITKIKEFSNSIVRNENFYLYLLKYAE